jgi:hypothetical protein
LEFSRTRAHYLVFKEQVLLIRIVSTSAPLSRGLFLLLACAPPRAAPVYVTNPRFPVKHLFQKKVASCQWPVFGFGFWVAQAFQPVHLTSSPHPKAAASTTFPVCRTSSGLAAHLRTQNPNQWPGKPAPRPRCLTNK